MKKNVLLVLVLAFLLTIPVLFATADPEHGGSSHAPGSGYGHGHGMMGPPTMGRGYVFDGSGPGFAYGIMGPEMIGGGFGFGFGMERLGPTLLGTDPFDRLQRALNLTDNQVVRLRGLWLDFVRSASEAQADLRISRAQLQNLLASRPVDMNQVQVQIRQMGSQWSDLQLARARLLVGVRSVLTQEQLQRLSSRFPGTRRLGAPYGRFRHRGAPDTDESPVMPGPGRTR